MSAVLLLPVVLSLLLLAAHFLRDQNMIVVGVCMLMPLLLLVRRAWVVRVVQVVLLLGALEWLRTIVIVAARRQEHDQPWMRMAIILGAVGVFTLASGLLFATPRLRRRYFAAR